MFMYVLIITSLAILGLLYWKRKSHAAIHLLAQELLNQAQMQANKLLEEANSHAKELTTSAEMSLQLKRQQLEKEHTTLEQKEQDFLQKQQKWRLHQQELEKREQALDKQEKELTAKSLLTPEEAKAKILQDAALEAEADCAKLLLLKLQEATSRAADEAHKLIISALSRLPAKPLEEASLSTIHLPNEEIKAKIIGREGKNIKAFQQLTGVTVVIDETPEALQLSCFDPRRRAIAKMALQKLIADGRISISRIEEEVQHATNKLPEIQLEHGLQAVKSVKIPPLHQELLRLLGALHFRTSFGQNLLDHSVEVANIMGILAAELQLNVTKAKTMGLLHDIGKAITIDPTTSHAMAGYRTCLEYGVSEEIANGILCHHDETQARSPEAQLVKCADYLSGARPGVRQESSDLYFKRLSDLEAQALTFDGVKSAFALSRGKELQVFVRPDAMDDLGALCLAKQIAAAIKPLSGPTPVQVTVIRESRSIHYSND